MNLNPYHLQISPKTKLFNFFRRFFILIGIDKILPKFTRHSSINSFAARLIPPNYLYDSSSMRKLSFEGINMKLDISDAVEHFTYYSFDEPALQALYRFITPGMTIIDIGANIGATTLNIAKRVGATGKVFSFEPSPCNYQKALDNIGLNNFPNIKLINQGLGDKKSAACLYNVNLNNRGMQRLLGENSEISSYDKTEVEIDTLDRSMQLFEIPPPSLIKIDVEGYELKVLKGSWETLKKNKPALFIELDDNNLKEQGSEAKELIEFLLQLQYNIIVATNGKIVNEATDYSNCHFDILCT
jgi:FkbM family methyltransferase